MDDKKLLKDLLSPGAEILGAESYRKTAILIPVYQDGQDQILFTKRAEEIPQGSEICFPGGKYDPAFDQNLQDTALRETEEEIGIPRTAYSKVISLGYYLAPFGVVIDCYIGLLKGPPSLKPNPDEVAAVFSMTLTELLQAEPEEYHLGMEIHPHEKDKKGQTKVHFPTKELGLPVRYHQSWKGPLYTVHHFTTPEGPLWDLRQRS